MAPTTHGFLKLLESITLEHRSRVCTPQSWIPISQTRDCTGNTLPFTNHVASPTRYESNGRLCRDHADRTRPVFISILSCEHDGVDPCTSVFLGASRNNQFLPNSSVDIQPAMVSLAMGSTLASTDPNTSFCVGAMSKDRASLNELVDVHPPVSISGLESIHHKELATWTLVVWLGGTSIAGSQVYSVSCL